MASRTSLARLFGLGARSRRKVTARRWHLEQLERRELLATITWSGAVDRNWDVAGNWAEGVVPGAGDVARFADTSPGNVELGATARSVIGVQFDNTGGSTFTLNGGPLNMSGGLLQFGSGINTINSAITGGPSFSVSATSGSLTLSGAVTVVNNLSLDVGSNTLVAVSGGITDGAASFALTKTGPGALLLSGASTYDGGTNINAGVLSVNNVSGSATGTGAVSMNPGSILLGTGTIAGSVTMNPGSLVSPGGGYQNGAFDDAPLNAFGFPTALAVPPGAPIFGTLTIGGDLTLGPNTISTSDIRAGGSDLTIVGGNLTIANGQAVGTGEIEGGVTPPGTVTFLSKTSAGPIVGEFAQLTNNQTFTFDGFDARINYDAGVGGNDLVITFTIPNDPPINSVPGLPPGIATTNYVARVATATGPVFGTTVPLNTVVTGFFTFNANTPDANPGNANFGDYPHTSGGAFLASFLGINLTGSATPFVQVETISDTFRYVDGLPQGGVMSVNGTANPNADLFIAWTDPTASSYPTDALVVPLPFAVPPLSSNPPDSFPHTFSISDGTNTILLQLTSVSSVAGSVTTDEDTPLAFTGANVITVSDPDAGTNAIRTTVSVTAGTGTLTATAAPGAAITGAGNSLQIDGPQAAINATLATLVYTPATNFNGGTTLTVVTDDQGQSGTTGAQVDTDAIAITVAPVNDEPTFTIADPPAAVFNSGLNTVLNFATNITAGAPDESGQILTFSPAVIGATTGNLTFSTLPSIDPATGTLTYAATNGTSGTAQVTFTLVDNGSSVAPNDNSRSQTVTITVAGLVVNQPPTITARAAETTNEDTTLAFTGLSDISIADADAGTANVTATLSVPANRGTLSVSAAVIPGLTVTGNGTTSITLVGPQAAINTKLDSLSYSPVANANVNTVGGPVVLTVQVNDGGNTGGDGAKTATSTVNITITPVNDAPILNPISNPPTSQTNAGLVTVPGFASATAGPPTATDELPPAPTAQTVTFNTSIVTTTNGLTFVLGREPSISPTGVLTYEATPGSTGTATIQVIAQDSGTGANTSAPRTFVIEVLGAAPTIDGPFSTVRNAPTTFTFESLNALAPDGTPIVFNVDWDGDGEVDETLDAEFQGGVASVTVVHIFPVETEEGVPNEVIVFTTDADGDSEPTSHFIDVKIFDLIPNPDTGADDLVFGGTFLADRIVVSLLYNGGIQIRDNSDFYVIPGTLGNITGNVVIWGGDGGDSINISANVGYDFELHGQDGNDYIAGGRFNDILDGGAGNDRLVDGFGNNTYIGGDGVDILSGGKGNDELYGGAGRDTLNGAAGNDIMDGGEGNDSIVGMDGNDIGFGGPGNDTLRGERGHDILLGGDQNDNIQGGPGRDILVGGNGADTMYGGVDDDILIGDDLDLGNGGDIALDVETLRLMLTDWLKPTPLKGASGRAQLLSDRLNETTILDDNARDLLFGQIDADWFLTYSKDQVKDLRPEDLKTALDA